jgi:hypothetical protein
MPVKSKAQYKYMQMMAHNPSKSKKSHGPSPEVAKEFIEKTSAKKRKEFSRK